MDESDLKVLAERLENFMAVTVEYRKSLCKKVDAVQTKIDELSLKMTSLPCTIQNEKIEALKVHVNAIWGFIGAIALAIVYDWIKK